MMLYPLKFQPVYKNILWGGRNIEKKFNRQIPDGNIAESWEVCCRDDGMSIVLNGSLEGKSLKDIIGLYKDNLLGTSVYNKYHDFFPIFIKIIDANDKLSVQVHPDDEYAAQYGEGSGKTEMWYIIDAKPGASLIYGLKPGTTKNEFKEMAGDKAIENLLNKVPVSPGDVFYIPAGTVHAILDGILIAEIQQNSNTTYRVYDWSRVDKNGKPRELHLDKAVDVINFGEQAPSGQHDHVENYDSFSLRELSKNEYFTVEELRIKSSYEEQTDGSKFYIYMVIEGCGKINYAGGFENLSPGETVMVPASPGKYQVEGTMKMLRIYI